MQRRTSVLQVRGEKRRRGCEWYIFRIQYIYVIFINMLVPYLLVLFMFITLLLVVSRTCLQKYIENTLFGSGKTRLSCMSSAAGEACAG